VDELKKLLATPRGRVLALALGVVVIAGGGYFALKTLGGSSDTPSAAPPARTTSTTSTSSTSARTTATTTATTKTATQETQTTALISDKLPAYLGAELIDHPVLVVSVYSPDAVGDADAVAEARAGAAQANAGFIAINVDSNRQLELLSTLTSVTADPLLLIVDRKGSVLFQNVGMVDRDAVSQAVANAEIGLNQQPDAAPPREPWDGYWKAKADVLICQANDAFASIADSTDSIKRLTNEIAVAQRYYLKLAAIRAVGPSAAAYQDFLRAVSDGNAASIQLRDALKKGNYAAFNRAARRLANDNNAWLVAEGKIGVACTSKSAATKT
jgi:hypothetical protein